MSGSPMTCLFGKTYFRLSGIQPATRTFDELETSARDERPVRMFGPATSMEKVMICVKG